MGRPGKGNRGRRPGRRRKNPFEEMMEKWQRTAEIEVQMAAGRSKLILHGNVEPQTAEECALAIRNEYNEFLKLQGRKKAETPTKIKISPKFITRMFQLISQERQLNVLTADKFKGKKLSEIPEMLCTIGEKREVCAELGTMFEWLADLRSDKIEKLSLHGETIEFYRLAGDKNSAERIVQKTGLAKADDTEIKNLFKVFAATKDSNRQAIAKALCRFIPKKRAYSLLGEVYEESGEHSLQHPVGIVREGAILDFVLAAEAYREVNNREAMSRLIEKVGRHYGLKSLGEGDLRSFFTVKINEDKSVLRYEEETAKGIAKIAGPHAQKILGEILYGRGMHELKGDLDNAVHYLSSAFDVFLDAGMREEAELAIMEIEDEIKQQGGDPSWVTGSLRYKLEEKN
ncbi:MAG: hypothetical protein V1672_03545 [Candidatus Diapherotrites archaeon]